MGAVVQAGLDKLRTPAMKLTIQHAFENHGLFARICSPEQLRIAASDLEKDIQPVVELRETIILDAAPENEDVDEPIGLQVQLTSLEVALDDVELNLSDVSSDSYFEADSDVESNVSISSE